jgi:hypothetical protein
MQDCNCQQDMTRYYRAQLKICLDSQLFGDNRKNHAGKVLMLFSEIFSFLSDRYGIDRTTTYIIQFQNSPSFKKWFWKVKYMLGQVMEVDPTFSDIGKWIGRGFFLKITFNIIYSMDLEIDQKFIDDLVKKQSAILKLLAKGRPAASGSMDSSLPALLLDGDEYTLLGDTTKLTRDIAGFIISNLI